MKYRVNTQAELDKIIPGCREGDIIYLGKGDFFVEQLPPGITFVGKGANSTTLRYEGYAGYGKYFLKDLLIGGNQE